MLSYSQLMLRSTFSKDSYIYCLGDDIEVEETSLEMNKMVNLRQELNSDDSKSSALSL